MTSQTLSLNLIPKGICPRLYVSQYDKGQEWNFDIYAGTEAYTIPSGSAVTIQGTKPDKTGFQYACSFSGNRVTATEQQQMTIIAGEVPAEIRIEKNNEIIATLNFIIAVEKAALADDTVVSETDLPLIEEAIEVLGHADELVNQIQGYATTAQNAASTATTKASQASTSATNASNSATTASNAATTATNKASEATSAASTATTKASQASTSATSAAGSASTATTKAQEAAASAAAAAQSAAHLTIDSEMSTTSENALQNKVVTSAIQNLSNQVKRNAYGSSLNKLKMNTLLYGVTDVSGGTFTRNSDNTVIVNVTDNTHALVVRSLGRFTLVAGKKYKILGGYNKDTCMITIRNLQGGNWSNNTVSRGVQSPVVSSTVDEFIANSTEDVLICVRIPASNVINNAKLYPMIIDMDVDSVPSGNITDYYVPYYESNREIDDDIDGLIDNQNVNGAVNMLPNNNATQVKYGITYTVNPDGTITASGKATSPNGLYGSATLPKGTYKLSGCPSGGAQNTYYLEIPSLNIHDYGDGAIFTLSEETTLGVTIARINNTTTTYSGLTFKPMISLASLNLSYNDYVPFAKTNKKLTEDVGSLLPYSTLLGNLTNGDVTSFLKVRDVAMNIYWTDNTNASDWSNMTNQQLTDVVQALLDTYKKLGGAKDIVYFGRMKVRNLQSNGTLISEAIYTPFVLTARETYNTILSTQSGGGRNAGVVTLIWINVGSALINNLSMWSEDIRWSRLGLVDSAAPTTTGVQKLYSSKYTRITTYKG